jgi:hypothetical protein
LSVVDLLGSTLDVEIANWQIEIRDCEVTGPKPTLKESERTTFLGVFHACKAHASKRRAVSALTKGGA